MSSRVCEEKPGNIEPVRGIEFVVMRTASEGGRTVKENAV